MKYNILVFGISLTVFITALRYENISNTKTLIDPTTNYNYSEEIKYWIQIQEERHTLLKLKCQELGLNAKHSQGLDLNIDQVSKTAHCFIRKGNSHSGPDLQYVLVFTIISHSQQTGNKILTFTKIFVKPRFLFIHSCIDYLADIFVKHQKGCHE